MKTCQEDTEETELLRVESLSPDFSLNWLLKRLTAGEGRGRGVEGGRVTEGAQKVKMGERWTTSS